MADRLHPARRIARGATPESSGSYGFVRLEGDLLRTEVAGMSLTTGVYGAAGHSSVDVKDDDGSRAGTVRDDAGSLGGYLNLTHTSSGLWADIVAQGTRHSMKASSDNNDFRARGWGWLGSLETGLPFSITDNLMLEPQLQYTWQGLSLDDGQDNAGYVKFGHGSTQHVRAGFRLGSHNDMTFGEGTSSRDTLRDSTKHRVSELPVNWWVQPSVIRTFSSRGDMSMGIRGRFRDADAYPLDQAFPLLMKQLKLMLTSGELNPRHQHTVTLYAKGLTCEADTLGSCGYVYLAVYPTPETKK
ncbi:autotransporter domain-containing protein [Escherichia coli]|nr:type IV toxin-antitoxin system YeeU family antitoxin [Escherichia coli]TRO01624.1 autotransporter domain-containing protein [Escherichia coli]